MNTDRFIILFLSMSCFTCFSLAAQNCSTLEPCQTEPDNRTVGALDGYNGWDYEPPCYYYYDDVDMDESWFDREVSWPGRREDSWFDQLTR